jgi:hypothetical protein
VPRVRGFTTGRISVIIEELFETSFTKKNNSGDKIENLKIFLCVLPDIENDFIGQWKRSLTPFCDSLYM